MKKYIRVWDIPTRVFHWSLALSFFGAYATGESERWALVHVTCGYTMLGLTIFRIVWGLVGTRYARFSEFMSGPLAVARYLSGLAKGHPPYYVGHNPVGALAILALLLLSLISGVSGWMVYNDIGGGWLEGLHESASSIMLAVVFIHIAGVIITSFLHRENLVRSMIDGRKHTDDSHQAITSNRPIVALLVLASIAGFWLWSFGSTSQGMAFPISGQEIKVMLHIVTASRE